jgi:hypothetical protein
MAREVERPTIPGSNPVVKPITIRTVLAIAVSAGWAIHQVDVSNTFLHGHLQEDVYMSEPLGCPSPQVLCIQTTPQLLVVINF